jgi:hypothetical protein
MANVADYPKWLLDLFTITNDFILCEKHWSTMTFKIYFCIDHCSQICKQCKDSEDHKDCKNIFQLRKGTPTYINKKTDTQITITNLTIEGTDVTTYGNFASLNDVQDYSFNSLIVYYIFGRGKKPSDSHSCKICGHKLVDPLKKFCSLHCMVKDHQDTQLKAINHGKSQNQVSLSYIASTSKNNFEGEASTSYGFKTNQNSSTMIWNTRKQDTCTKLVPIEETSTKSKRSRPKKQTNPTRSPLGNTCSCNFL